MSEKFGAILFLGIFALGILGFIFAFIYIIIKSLTKGSGHKKAAVSNGWQYWANDKKTSEGAGGAMVQKLENHFYKTRENLIQSTSNMIEGNYMGTAFQYGHYYGHSRHRQSGKGYSQNLTIYILPRFRNQLQWLLLYRTKIMRALPVEALTARLGFALSPPEKDGPDWLLVSNEEGFEELGLSSSHWSGLQETIKELYGIYFLDGHMVYMFNVHRKASSILSDLDKVLKLHTVLG